MSARELLEAYGSPLWLADVDRLRSNLEEFGPLGQSAGRGCGSLTPTRRTACSASCRRRVVVDGSGKPDGLLSSAGVGGALVLIDSTAELEPAARGARAGRPDPAGAGHRPLCLNVDVVHASAELPELAPGAMLVARYARAYQQTASTQFGERSPSVVVRRDGRWSLYRCGERASTYEQEYERHAA